MATVDEVEVFHSALSAHLASTVGVKLAHMAGIKRMDLPVAKIDEAGKVRIEGSRLANSVPHFVLSSLSQIQIESGDHAKTILRFLTSICQLHLESLTPRIGITSGDNLLT